MFVQIASKQINTNSADQPLIIELTGESAENFRKDWHYATQQPMSAAG
jgi:hypothetical protein